MTRFVPAKLLPLTLCGAGFPVYLKPDATTQNAGFVSAAVGELAEAFLRELDAAMVGGKFTAVGIRDHRRAMAKDFAGRLTIFEQNSRGLLRTATNAEAALAADSADAMNRLPALAIARAQHAAGLVDLASEEDLKAFSQAIARREPDAVHAALLLAPWPSTAATALLRSDAEAAFAEMTASVDRARQVRSATVAAQVLDWRIRSFAAGLLAVVTDGNLAAVGSRELLDIGNDPDLDQLQRLVGELGLAGDRPPVYALPSAPDHESAAALWAQANSQATSA